MKFEQRYSPASLREMESEFERIMRPAVTGIEWRMLNGLSGKEAFRDIIVVRFEGSCEGDERKSNPLRSRFLGFTYEENGQVLPFARIDCSKILGLLALQSSDEAKGIFHVQQMLGRAMGRVLAHEAYHAILQTTVHAARGIARPSLTLSELFGPELRFDSPEIAALNTALSQPSSGKLISAAITLPLL